MKKNKYLAKRSETKHPQTTIMEAFNFVKRINSQNLDFSPAKDVCVVLGFPKATFTNFRRPLSSAKQFGLLMDQALISITAEAKKLIESDRTEQIAMLKEIFIKPPLYESLVKMYNGKQMPSVSDLADQLQQDYGIVESVKEHAAFCFIESAKVLDLIKDGVLVYYDDEFNGNTDISRQMSGLPPSRANAEDIVEKDEGPVAVDDQKEERNFVSQDANMNVSRCDDCACAPYNLEIPMLNGPSIKLQFPEWITPKDVDYIELYFNNLFPAALANLREKLHNGSAQE